MPQASPMNWSILSLTMISSIMFIYSYANEKMNWVNTSMTKTNLHVLSWDW